MSRIVDDPETIPSRMKSLYYAAGFQNLSKGKIKAGFKCLLVSRNSTVDAGIRVDARDVLQCFQQTEAEGKERPIDNYQYVNNKQDIQFLSLCPASLLEGYKTKSTVKVEKKLLDKQFSEIAKSISTINVKQQPKIPAILIQKAVIYLTRFLELIRKPTNDQSEDPQEQFAIEFALVSLYIRKLRTSADAYSKIEQIVQNNNHYSIAANTSAGRRFRDMLEHYGLIRHLALLYKSQGPQYYSQALDILRNRSKFEIFKDRYSGVNDVIEILRSIDGPDLMSPAMIPHLVHVVNKAKGNAVTVFTARRKHEPDVKHVIHFLRAHPIRILQQYLYHLIYEQNVEDEALHTEYAITLTQSIVELIPRESNQFFSTEAALNPYVRVKAGEEVGLLGQYRKQLLFHLANSKFYNHAAVLEALKDKALYEELVVLYRVMNRHYDALRTLLFNLLDHKEAERYCKRVFNEEIEQDKQKQENFRLIRKQTSARIYNPHYITYIKVFVDMLKEKPTMDMTPLLDLLNYSAHEIDLSQAVDILPENMPCVQILQGLTQAIQNTHFRNKSGAFTRNVFKTANQEAIKRQWEATQRRIVISAHTKCSKCSQVIGQSVFATFPDLTVVHYHCMLQAPNSSEKLKSIHPKSKRNFCKFPVDL
jgi:hypothetical protein